MKAVRRKIKSRQPFYRRRFFLWGILAVVLIGGLVYLVFISPVFQRRQLVIEGEKVIDPAEIEGVLLEALERRPSASLAWPIGGLADTLKVSFPYIQEAEIRRQWPDTLIVVLREKAPDFCLVGDEDVFLLDEEGDFLESVESCPSELTRIMAENLDGVLPKEIWSEVQQINQAALLFPKTILREIGIGAFRIELKMSTTHSADHDWSVYLDRMSDLSRQLRRLEIFLRTKDQEELEILDYVDVGGHEERVFYKNRPIE